jgi:glycosyltransferase involved in cell wall biosynthesis
VKVGLNLVWWREPAGGIGRYARELIPHLLKADPGLRLSLFVSRDAPADLFDQDWAGDVRWRRLPVRLDGLPWHLPMQFAGVPALAAAERLDLVHGPANVVPVHIPGVRSVVTIPDLVFLHEGADWEAGRAARSSARLALFCARHADRILAISNWAAADLVRTAGLDAKRIDVAALGVRQAAEPTPEAELRRRLELGDEPVILCVAQKRPYKGHAVLIRALAELDGSHPTLVLPGAATPYEAELRSLADDLGVGDRVRFLGWVSERDLEGLYVLAACMALPSRHEGFGLPVLEAMRCGTPVVCSDRTALPEVAGDAALLVDPEDVGAVAEAIGGVLASPELADDLAARGRDRAERFTWAATAEATLASYRRALER